LEVNVKRLGLSLMASVLLILGLAVPAATQPASRGSASAVNDGSSARDPVKINVMGVWAHPDDDTSIIGPCGVWNQLYDIRCGIIMHTRGEGGSNSVGDESGPDLGLRRENEDRASHFRSGTVDIFNTDLVDFYYNTSAALTEFFWGHERTLERTVRIIRETRPDVMVGFSPAGSGHGKHHYYGRMIWEAIAAAADPTMFPEQLADGLEPWLVKKTTSGGSTQGSGGQNAPHCTTGFTPAQSNPFTVHGVWTGHESPYAREAISDTAIIIQSRAGNVWIDHCEFEDHPGHPDPDGGIDIHSGAKYITISWNVFNKGKVLLWGSSNVGDFDDPESGLITAHHNWWPVPVPTRSGCPTTGSRWTCPTPSPPPSAWARSPRAARSSGATPSAWPRRRRGRPCSRSPPRRWRSTPVTSRSSTARCA
jgi:LmbE family N-acetylglucosaminyl deacetylase